MDTAVTMVTSPIASLSGSSLAPEVERDALREKVEHFKVLIRKLQEDLQSHKIRKGGAETVSKLLQESKQESVGLKKKIGQLETVIRNLQSRLEKHGLSTEIVLNENETYVPGHSKRLLENLTRENSRLRNLARSKSGDPEELAYLQQTNADLQREKNALEANVFELQHILQSSDSEKDQTITLLREELAQCQNEVASREEKVRHLAEESRTLQQQLFSVAEQCRQLARKLDEQGKITTPETVCSESSDNSGELARMAEENKLLRKQHKEVYDMNRRWQEHNGQRDAYLTQLQTELAHFRAQVAELEARRGDLAPDTQAEVNQVLDENRRLSKETEHHKRLLTQLVSERDRFKREFENAHEQIGGLKAEMRQLRSAPAMNGGSGGGGRTDASETIEALKAQIQICTEDFESERRDRERAQNKVSRLETETTRLRKEIESLKRSMSNMANTWVSPRNDYPAPRNEYSEVPFHNNAVQQSCEGLAARGVSSSPKRDVRLNLDRFNVIDGAHVTNPSDVTSPTMESYVYVENRPVIMDNMTDNTDSGNPGTEPQSFRQVYNVPNVPDQRIYIGQSPDRRESKDDEKFLSLNASSFSSHSKDSDHARDSGSPPNSKRTSYDLTTEVTSSDQTMRQTMSLPVETILRCPSCDKGFTNTQHPELLAHIEKCIS
ncbi:TNIP2-like protein, partial [Mya arenaria]